jgi:uncharacterized protein
MSEEKERQALASQMNRAVRLLRIQPQKALQDLEVLAERGSIISMFNVGMAYKNGVLGDPDMARAEWWFRRAASLGSHPAEFMLGIIYMRRGDRQPGLEMLQSAAGAGYAPAMRALGGLYLRGDGVPQDLAAAQSWLERASSLGNLLARQNLARALIAGRFGVLKIPRGVFLFCRAIFDAVYYGREDENSDRFH